MGEVYRARDTKLGREVALKVLPDLFLTDPDRLARFQREAEVLASLNHPHIAGIYGLEDSGGVHALSWSSSKDRRWPTASRRDRFQSARRSLLLVRSPRRSKSHTRRASSTATSNPRTSK